MRAPFLWFTALLLLVPCAAHAEDPPHLELAAADAVRIDGKLDEPAWASATVLPVAKIDVPDVVGPEATRALTPSLRAVVHAGQLCLGLSCAEPPGTGSGVLVFLARGDATTVDEAWSLAYRPLNPRASRYIVRTPQGVGRAACALAGALDVSQPAAWSLELRVPLAALGAKPSDPVRLAVGVCTRTPSLVTSAPAQAMWRGPRHWLLLKAPEAGWQAATALTPEAAKAEADAEVQRDQAWNEFLRRSHGASGSGLLPGAPNLREPLDTVVGLRPELQPVVDTILGDIYERAAAYDDAQKAYDAALATAPGWSEARYGRDVRLRVRRLVGLPRPDGTPTDYASARAEAEAWRTSGNGWDRLAADLAQGLLDLKACVFPSAIELLGRVAARLPADEWPNLRSERARAEIERHAMERQLRRREAEAQLPRVALETSRGRIVVELFQEDVPNAVNHFVWLVEHGFYDGTRVHHAAPNSHAALGDPLSRDDATLAQAGLGTAGYEVRVKASKRRPFRGSVAFPMPKAESRTVGCGFVLLTGLEIDAPTLAVFGVIVEGQDVADSLRAGDRLEHAKVVRKTESRTYRPVGLDGKPAPEPK